MAELKVYIPSGGGGGYTKWLPAHIEETNDIYEADLVLFTGGSDVDPRLYNQSEGRRTHVDAKRDQFEKEVFEMAQKRHIKMLGVCRGSQFLCVMAGGELVQDMYHPHHHDIKTWDNKTFRCISTHHQMAFPYRLPSSEYRMIGWAEKISTTYTDGENVEIVYHGKMLKYSEAFAEPEIVYYPQIDALGIQSHPEMMPINDPFVVYCQDVFNKFYNEKLS